MTNLLQTTAISLSMSLISVGGTVCLKRSFAPGKQQRFISCIAGYAACAALFLVLLRESEPAFLSGATSILQMGLVTSFGVWMSENMSAAQWVALVLAMASASSTILIPIL